MAAAGPLVWSECGRDDAALRAALVTGVSLGLPGISIARQREHGRARCALVH